ncbi:unnamed protein product [Urochloa humidicola]
MHQNKAIATLLSYNCNIEKVLLQQRGASPCHGDEGSSTRAMRSSTPGHGGREGGGPLAANHVGDGEKISPPIMVRGRGSHRRPWGRRSSCHWPWEEEEELVALHE